MSFPELGAALTQMKEFVYVFFFSSQVSRALSSALRSCQSKLLKHKFRANRACSPVFCDLNAQCHASSEEERKEKA